MDREDIKMLVNKWWEIYNDKTLDYKKRTTMMINDYGVVMPAEPMNMGPFIAALSEAGRVEYVTAPSAA